ncbi:Hsp20/alpha crystallin family protein [Gordoniibacillus kamchatkensis]|uniref:Hsp20/alpha crystallin family protein n=1 Tax=Gordoniibacillus kamchatkensis TaxID=1590651 RepID=UPI000696091F|nr:Hsp20/alpha crystallin family protein [Paenibacillus sp. VKM B-2647]
MSAANNSRGGGGMWSEIEKFISDKLSFMNPSGNIAGQFLNQPDWVQNIVRDALSKALPGGLAMGGLARKDGGRKAVTSEKPRISTEVFETHRDIIAKIKLPPKENPRALQVLVRSDRIKLLGLPGGEPTFISLPAPVVANSARARYREGTLEVYARKRKKGNYFDTYVEY